MSYRDMRVQKYIHEAFETKSMQYALPVLTDHAALRVQKVLTLAFDIRGLWGLVPLCNPICVSFPSGRWLFLLLSRRLTAAVATSLALVDLVSRAFDR